MTAAARTRWLPNVAGLNRSPKSTSRTAAVNRSCDELSTSIDSESTRPRVSTMNFTTTVPLTPARRRASGYRGATAGSRSCITTEFIINGDEPASPRTAGWGHGVVQDASAGDRRSPKSSRAGTDVRSTGGISDGMTVGTRIAGIRGTASALVWAGRAGTGLPRAGSGGTYWGTGKYTTDFTGPVLLVDVITTAPMISVACTTILTADPSPRC